MDLYFAGSSHTLSSQWINELNLNRLFSQELNRSEIAKMVEMRKTGKYTGKILIDSGAFTAHTKGISVDVDEYIDYLNSITEYVDCFAQVDTIPGQFGKPKTTEQLKAAPASSFENYLYMRPKLKEPDKLIPVYHQGEEVKWLRNLLEWTDENGKHIPYIGISPANDKSQKEKDKFIEMCFREIKKSSNPNVKTHAFGMTNTSTLTAFPFTSGDSSSWVLSAVNGGIFTKFGVLGVSLQSKNSNAYRGKSAAEKVIINDYIASKGFDILNMIEADDDIVVKRIQAKLEPGTISDESLYQILNKKMKCPDGIVKEVVKFEKGKSIKGEFDYKAYLERIHWDICYLAEWQANYKHVPHTFSRKTLLGK